MKRLLLSLFLLPAFLCTQSRPKVGLILGGGGAKGAAEIGALKYIERFDIPIDYVVGTSIGSIIGSLYAAGYKADDLEKLLCGHSLLATLTDRREDLRFKPFTRDIHQGDTLNYIFGFPALNFRRNCIGLLSCDSVEHLIDTLLQNKGIRNFQDYRRFHTNFRCVATNFQLFNSITEQVLRTGKVSTAVRASMAFPVVIKHQERDNQHLIDGGMMNNLPVDIVKNEADVVIVIDLQQTEIKPNDNQLNLNDLTGFIRDWREGGVSGIIEKLANWLMAKTIREDQWGIIGWALHRPDNRKYLENLQLYQGNNLIYIHPRLPGYNVASFGQASLQKMVDIGFEEARKHTEELRNLMRRTNRFSQ